jgi:Holliday junction resolvasome RuvABC DNA-binding subunit
MNRKRQEAQHAAAEGRARAAAKQARAEAQDVVPWLRQLGFRADEVRRAAAHCDTIPDAPLEERIRLALSYLGPRRRHRREAAVNAGTA